MFWKSRSEQSTPPVSSPASADSRLHSELDRALDTLASVLRSLGRHTPFGGHELPGQVRCTIVGGQVAYESWPRT